MEGTLTEGEWMGVIKYLYNEQDSCAVEGIIRRYINPAYIDIHESKAAAASIVAASIAATAVVADEMVDHYSTSMLPVNQKTFKTMSTAKDPKRLGYTSPSLHPQQYYSNTPPPKIKSARVSIKPTQPPAAAQVTVAHTYTLEYTALYYILLNFQLELHIQYLSKFYDAFTAHDDDNDGILNHREFGNCISFLKGQANAALWDGFLQQVDPSFSGIVTFSNCVSHLGKLFM